MEVVFLVCGGVFVVVVFFAAWECVIDRNIHEIDSQQYVCVNNSWTTEIKRGRQFRKPSRGGYGSGRT